MNALRINIHQHYVGLHGSLVDTRDDLYDHVGSCWHKADVAPEANYFRSWVESRYRIRFLIGRFWREAAVHRLACPETAVATRASLDPKAVSCAVLSVIGPILASAFNRRGNTRCILMYALTSCSELKHDSFYFSRSCEKAPWRHIISLRRWYQ